ncbi:MAG: 3-hydroxyisobutyrate dehydrogenase [Alphaproteobacteria bacterium]
MKIGFIGIGNMGGPMARNLIAAGHQVAVLDLSLDAIAALVDAGATAAGSPIDAISGADSVISMLPAGRHVREVYCGDGGIIAAAGEGTLLIDCSTIDVVSARAVAEEASERGLFVLDAPVSGGVAGAEAAALTFMVGGDAAAFARAEPILSTMGKMIVHAGASGNGQVAKICNNMILGVSMIALGEAFTLGEKLGLEAQTLFDISSNASGSCWAMLNHLPVPGIVETAAANRDFKPGFAVDMMLKDLRLAQQAAQEVGAATPMGAEAAALFGMFSNAGNGGLDYSAIVKMIAGR